MRKLLSKIDKLLSPPPLYVNLTYKDRIQKHLYDIKIRKNVMPNCIDLTMLVAMLFFSKLLTPLILLVRCTGFRFITIDLSQIGSVIYLDILLKENFLTKKTPKKKMFALASHYSDGNKYLFNLYSSHVIFVRNPFLKLILSPFFVSPLFEDNSFKYDSVYHTENNTHAIWNKYHAEGHAPLIRFPSDDFKKAQSILHKYIPQDAPFVALHARDTGFYKISSQTTRNGNIFNYEDGIRYLLEKGYAVIRLGDKNAVSVDALSEKLGPLFFDYAHSDIKSEMMDSYLLSQCAFFIGTASGPASVPPIFNKNSCNINWFNASTAPWFMKGDVTTFKKFRYKKDHSLVPFEKLFLPPFSMNPNNAELDSLDIYLEENSPEEILSTIREFIDNIELEPSDLQTMAKLYLRKENYSYGSNGNFSNTILKSYFS